MNNYWNMNIQYLKYASQTDSYLVLTAAAVNTV